MTTDNFNALVEQMQKINTKVDSLSDSVANLDLKYTKIKYLSKLIDVNISYPAENDVLVYDKTGKWKNAQYDEIGFSQGEGGESNIYVIGIGDNTSPTNENVYSAARTKEDFISSKDNDNVWGNLTFYNESDANPHTTKIFIDEITSRNFQSNIVTGSGFIYLIKSNGNSYIEVDELAVRKAAVFSTLLIEKVNSVGGLLIVSVASNVITRVEESNLYYEGLYLNVWRCYYANQDETTGETINTSFLAGDIAKVQSFNITNIGVSENVKNHYYCGKVLGTGNGYIDLSQTETDSSTTEPPKSGDVLVQFGNTDNVDRQNLISISAYGNNSPSITLYQGVNSFDLTNKSMIEMGYDTSLNSNLGFFNVYGKMYIGTKPGSEKESYVKYDPTIDNGDGTFGKVLIKADIIVEGEDGDYTLIEGGYISSNVIKTDILVTTELIATAINTGGQDLVIGDGTVGKITITPDGEITATKLYAYGGEIGNFTIDYNGIGTDVGNSGSRLFLSDEYINVGTYNRLVRLGKITSSAGVACTCSMLSILESTYEFSSRCAVFRATGASPYDGTSVTDIYNGNHAVILEKGDLLGFRLRVMRTDTNLNYSYATVLPGIIESVANSNITIHLPVKSYCEDGTILFVRKVGMGNVQINPNGNKLMSWGNSSTTGNIEVVNGEMLMLTYDLTNSMWLYNKFGN